METLRQHITHLLWRDGLATVPGVGVFTLHRNSSVIDDGSVSAPAYSVSFERSSATTDAALVTSLTRTCKISKAEAEKEVAESSHSFAQALMSAQGLEFDGIGRLRCGENSGEIEFTPSEPLVSVSAWLRPLSLEPLEIKKPEVADVAAAANALAQRREALARSLRRTASSAAAIAVFVLMAFVVSQLPTRKTHQPQVASFGFEQLTASPAVDEPDVNASQATEPALVLILNTPDDGTAPAKVRPAKDAVAEQSITPDRYCLVVASLSSRSEADKYIKAHSTTERPLSLLDADGRWRVYAISGPTIDDVLTTARATGLYDSYPSAWICRR